MSLRRQWWGRRGHKRICLPRPKGWEVSQARTDFRRSLESGLPDFLRVQGSSKVSGDAKAESQALRDPQRCGGLLFHLAFLFKL